MPRPHEAEDLISPVVVWVNSAQGQKGRESTELIQTSPKMQKEGTQQAKRLWGVLTWGRQARAKASNCLPHFPATTLVDFSELFTF